MAITINGTGSITGLSAGGLPDSSITSDDIASGAVTAAKLASGAARSNFGAGAVLQVVSYEYTGTQSVSNNATWNATNITASITPTSSSSKIIIIAKVGFSSTDQNVGYGFSIYRNSTSLNNATGGSTSNATSQSMSPYRAGQPYDLIQVPLYYVDSPSTTSSTAYTVRCWCPNSPGYNTLINASQNNYSRSTSSIILMEIAA